MAKRHQHLMSLGPLSLGVVVVVVVVLGCGSGRRETVVVLFL